MSIATAIAALQQAKEDIAQAIEDKGVVTTGHGLADFADDIADIPTGGGDTTAIENLLLRCFSGESSGTQRATVIDMRHIGDISIYGLRPYAFYGLYAAELYLPPITSVNIPLRCFSDSHIPKIILPAHITALGQNCFYNAKITNFDAPAGITTIPNYCFYSCTALTSISLPGVTEIGANAFQMCDLLDFNSPLDIAPNLTKVGATAFKSCNALTEIDLPSQLTQVDQQSFSTCANLETAFISTKRLGSTSTANQAFGSCIKLKNVWIGEDCVNVPASSYSAAPFYGCTALTDIYCEVYSKPSGWGNYWHYKNASTQATVHWGVSRAEAEAIFAGE